MANKIYILLPVYNRRDITQLFIKCLKSQTYKNYHLILIDDGSTDGTEEMVRSQIQSLTVIKGKGDWWWAGALQQGYEWLQSQDIQPNDIVLMINDDTQFEDNFLEIGRKILLQNPDTLVLAQCYSQQTGQLIEAGVKVDWKNLGFHQLAKPEETNCLATKGLFLKFKDFLQVGGFHPQLLPHYLSDYEFTFRAFRKGLKLMTDPSLKLWGDEEATGYHKIEAQSLALFLKKFFSRKSPSNPLIWTNLVTLVCPWYWKLSCYVLIWIRAFRTILSVFVKKCLRSQ